MYGLKHTEIGLLVPDLEITLTVSFERSINFDQAED